MSDLDQPVAVRFRLRPEHRSALGRVEMRRLGWRGWWLRLGSIAVSAVLPEGMAPALLLARISAWRARLA